MSYLKYSKRLFHSNPLRNANIFRLESTYPLFPETRYIQWKRGQTPFSKLNISMDLYEQEVPFTRGSRWKRGQTPFSKLNISMDLYEQEVPFTIWGSCFKKQIIYIEYKQVPGYWYGLVNRDNILKYDILGCALYCN